MHRNDYGDSDVDDVINYFVYLDFRIQGNQSIEYSYSCRISNKRTNKQE